MHMGWVVGKEIKIRAEYEGKAQKAQKSNNRFRPWAVV